MDATTATLIGTAVAACGVGLAFAGVLVGQRMARNTQREHWLLDSRKEEFKELLSALAYSYTRKLSVRPMVALSPEEQKENHEAQIAIFRACHDRIYIARDITAL